MSRIVGVVLAGGSGRRMGGPKGDIVHDGLALATRSARALAPHCESIVISVAPGAPNPAPEFAAVEDRPPAARGPLSGIDAAFRAQGGAALLVLACDYPYASAALLGAILAADPNGADLVFPCDASGRDHPLVGLWRPTAAGPVASALNAGEYRVGALLAALSVKRLAPAAFGELDLARELVNWNRPEELDRSG